VIHESGWGGSKAAKELGRAIHEEKATEFIVSSSFEFEKFTRKPTFALAQSLFTHLEERDILDCMSKLRAFVDPGMRFFSTYFIGDRSKIEAGLRQLGLGNLQIVDADGQPLR